MTGSGTVTSSVEVPRVAVSGRALLDHGQGATIIVTRDRGRGGWCIYLDGDPKRAITVLDAEIMVLVRALTAEMRVCGGCGGLGVHSLLDP